MERATAVIDIPNGSALLTVLHGIIHGNKINARNILIPHIQGNGVKQAGVFRFEQSILKSVPFLSFISAMPEQLPQLLPVFIGQFLKTISGR